MKKDKRFLFIVILAGILCIPAPGEVESLDYERSLIGSAEPALAGIEQLAVVIVPPETKQDRDQINWEELQAKLTERLSKAGIKITPADAETMLDIAELRVYIDILKLEDSQQYVLRIQTLLSRAVCLAEQQNLFFKADVWNTEPVMQVVSVEKMSEKVADVVLEQVEEFIHVYLASNHQGTEPAKGKDAGTINQRKVGPVVKPIVSEHRYVASKNSKVFHKFDCSSASRIKPKNLVFYNSRSEAVQSGRRPCKLCNP